MILDAFLIANRQDDVRNSGMGDSEGAAAMRETKIDSRELLDKILSKEDWDFVSTQPTESLREMFRRDRREIKRQWLLRLRQQAEQALGLQSRAARISGRMRAGVAIKRLSNYALFRVVLSALLSLCRLSHTRLFVGAWRGLAEIAQRLESLLETEISGKVDTQANRLRSAATDDGSLQGSHTKDRFRNLEVEEAIERVRRRDLSGLRSRFAGLTYLSSIRDYNSGRYYHEGLSRSFSEDVMERAVSACHDEIFERLAHSPLSELTRELEIYVGTVPEVPATVLTAWSRLEPFRVLVPMNSDPVSTELFISNVRVALAILLNRGRNDQWGKS
jgi:hypothetical protein